NFIFFRIFVFSCGRHKHPHAKIGFFACWCATRTQKPRFSQTLGCVRAVHPHAKITFDRM
ncbi:Os08g0423400, partial [Oryza sativa Japonica Group]